LCGGFRGVRQVGDCARPSDLKTRKGVNLKQQGEKGRGKSTPKGGDRPSWSREKKGLQGGGRCWGVREGPTTGVKVQPQLKKKKKKYGGNEMQSE